MSYDEAIWDGDEADSSIGSHLAPTSFQTRDDAERRLGLAGGTEFKFDRIEFPFSTKYLMSDLKNKKSLEFSVANNALNAEEFSYSNKGDHEGDLGAQPYNIVNKVSFKNLTIGNMKAATNLFAEFPSIHAAKHHSFGQIPKSAPGKPANTVRFVVTPNTVDSGTFNANYKPEVLDHAVAFPELNKETIRKTYGKIGNKGVTWMDIQSPLINALEEEQFQRLRTDATNGVYHYQGDFADLENAEKKLLEVNEEFVAFSDLNPKTFAFHLTVPPERVYKSDENKHETRQPTFYELAAGPRTMAMLSSKQGNPEAAKAMKEFDNSYATFSGTIVIDTKKIAPKYVV